MTQDTPIKLLLVDDEPTLREPLAEYLTGQGFSVRQAESAALARSELRVQRPDLVLLDIMMPGEDGLSLTRHLVETQRVPVILLTALAFNLVGDALRDILDPTQRGRG